MRIFSQTEQLTAYDLTARLVVAIVPAWEQESKTAKSDSKMPKKSRLTGKKTFRTDFPEFWSTHRFPDTPENFYPDMADSLQDESVSDEPFPSLTELFTAHYAGLCRYSLAVSLANNDENSAGSGILTSEWLNKVSARDDGSEIACTRTGCRNKSAQGREFYRWAMPGAAGHPLL